MAHPPIHHRDRALRRLSLATKGVAAVTIIGTGGIWAAIAHAAAAPARTDGGTAVVSVDSDAPAPPVRPPASRGQQRAPVGAGQPTPSAGKPTPPPQPPSAAPVQNSQPAPDAPEPTYSGGS